MTHFVFLNLMLNAAHTKTRIIPMNAKAKYTIAIVKFCELVTSSEVPSGGIPPILLYKECISHDMTPLTLKDC